MVMSRRPVPVPTAPLSVPPQRTPIHLDDARSSIGLKRLVSDRDPPSVHVPHGGGDNGLQASRRFLEETPPKKMHVLPSWEGKSFMSVSERVLLLLSLSLSSSLFCSSNSNLEVLFKLTFHDHSNQAAPRFVSPPLLASLPSPFECTPSLVSWMLSFGI